MNSVLSRRRMLSNATMLAALPLLDFAPRLGLRVGANVARAAAPRAATPDEVLAAGLERGLPGISLRIDQAGTTLFSGQAGVSSLEAGTPLAANDRFRIYSIAKTFTAIVTLQLVDEGVLTLDDTVTDWLTADAVLAIPHADRVTIRQLLSHTSGIYDYAGHTDNTFFADAFIGPAADWSRVWTPLELLAYVDGAKAEPYFAPGQGVYYSSTNYILLGLIVEAATGRSYADELSERILAPLALADTTLETGRDLPADLVDGYQNMDGQTINISGLNLSWSWAAGGMVSTTTDLARFAESLFSGELLSPASQAAMFDFNPERWGDYGFGLGIYRTQTPNGSLIGMDGGAAGGNAALLRQPDANVTIVVLVNFDPAKVNEIVDQAVTWALAQPD